MSPLPASKPERRQRQRDPMQVVVAALSVTGWLILLAALFVLAEARPPRETFFERWYELRQRSTWNLKLAHNMFYLMLLSLCTSLTGLVINSRRHKRKGDEWRVSLILVACFSLLGLFLYLRSFT